MSRKRPAQPAPPPPGPPGYYWWRYRCKLSEGYGEWQVVRWDGERVQVFHSSHPWKLTCLFFQGGLWGPRILPPGEGDTRTALALARAGNRQNRKERQADPSDTGNADTMARKVRVVAEGIVDAFVQGSHGLRAVYAGHPEWQAELVERVAGLLGQAFGGDGP